jgi:hypothetical protein
MLLLWPFLILGKACVEASLSIAAFRIFPQFRARGNTGGELRQEEHEGHEKAEFFWKNLT